MELNDSSLITAQSKSSFKTNSIFSSKNKNDEKLNEKINSLNDLTIKIQEIRKLRHESKQRSMVSLSTLPKPKPYQVKPIKKKHYFKHPNLEYILGEMVMSPYMTKPLDPYPKAATKGITSILNLKHQGKKFSELSNNEKPYDVKEVRSTFIKEVMEFPDFYMPKANYKFKSIDLPSNSQSKNFSLSVKSNQTSKVKNKIHENISKSRESFNVSTNSSMDGLFLTSDNIFDDSIDKFDKSKTKQDFNRTIKPADYSIDDDNLDKTIDRTISSSSTTNMSMLKTVQWSESKDIYRNDDSLDIFSEFKRNKSKDKIISSKKDEKLVSPISSPVNYANDFEEDRTNNNNSDFEIDSKNDQNINYINDFEEVIDSPKGNKTNRSNSDEIVEDGDNVMDQLEELDDSDMVVNDNDNNIIEKSLNSEADYENDSTENTKYENFDENNDINTKFLSEDDIKEDNEIDKVTTDNSSNYPTSYKDNSVKQFDKSMKNYNSPKDDDENINVDSVKDEYLNDSTIESSKNIKIQRVSDSSKNLENQKLSSVGRLEVSSRNSKKSSWNDSKQGSLKDGKVDSSNNSNLSSPKVSKTDSPKDMNINTAVISPISSKTNSSRDNKIKGLKDQSTKGRNIQIDSVISPITSKKESGVTSPNDSRIISPKDSRITSPKDSRITSSKDSRITSPKDSKKSADNENNLSDFKIERIVSPSSNKRDSRTNTPVNIKRDNSRIESPISNTSPKDSRISSPKDSRISSSKDSRISSPKDSNKQSKNDIRIDILSSPKSTRIDSKLSSPKNTVINSKSDSNFNSAKNSKKDINIKTSSDANIVLFNDSKKGSKKEAQVDSEVQSNLDISITNNLTVGRINSPKDIKDDSKKEINLDKTQSNSSSNFVKENLTSSSKKINLNNQKDNNLSTNNSVKIKTTSTKDVKIDNTIDQPTAYNSTSTKVDNQNDNKLDDKTDSNKSNILKYNSSSNSDKIDSKIEEEISSKKIRIPTSNNNESKENSPLSFPYDSFAVSPVDQNQNDINKVDERVTTLMFTQTNNINDMLSDIPPDIQSDESSLKLSSSYSSSLKFSSSHGSSDISSSGSIDAFNAYRSKSIAIVFDAIQEKDFESSDTNDPKHLLMDHDKSKDMRMVSLLEVPIISRENSNNSTKCIVPPFSEKVTIDSKMKIGNEEVNAMTILTRDTTTRISSNSLVSSPIKVISNENNLDSKTYNHGSNKLDNILESDNNSKLNSMKDNKDNNLNFILSDKLDNQKDNQYESNLENNGDNVINSIVDSNSELGSTKCIAPSFNSNLKKNSKIRIGNEDMTAMTILDRETTARIPSEVDISNSPINNVQSVNVGQVKSSVDSEIDEIIDGQSNKLIDKKESQRADNKKESQKVDNKQDIRISTQVDNKIDNQVDNKIDASVKSQRSSIESYFEDSFDTIYASNKSPKNNLISRKEFKQISSPKSIKSERPSTTPKSTSIKIDSVGRQSSTPKSSSRIQSKQSTPTNKSNKNKSFK